MRFLVGLIGIPLGFIIIYYRKQIYDATGDFSWAEKYLGPGKSPTVIVLLGLLVAILALMYMLGTLQTFLQSTLGRIF